MLVLFSLFTAAAAGGVDEVFADLDADRPGCVAGVYGAEGLERVLGRGRMRDGGDALSAQTPMRIASTSKQFTAAAVLLLARDGVLDLDDPVSRWIDGIDPRVTLRQLLHHSSGLRDYLILMELSGIEEPYTLEQTLAVIERQRDLGFEPDSAFEYSNTGYLLLGEVVARATDSSLRAVADERLFGPLGMTNTHFVDDITTRPDPARAAGHAGGKAIEAASDLVGDGGVYTTLDDLAGWFGQLRSDALGIRDAQLARHTLTDGTELSYAAGLMHGDLGGVAEIAHSGSYAGFEADLRYWPEPDVGVAVLCNVEDEHPSRRARELGQVLLADRIQSTDGEAVGFDAEEAAAALGTYRLVIGEEIEMQPAEEGLTMVMREHPLPFVRTAPNTWENGEHGVKLVFGGKHDVVLHQGANVVPGERVRPLEPLVEVEGMKGTWFSPDIAMELRTKRKGNWLKVVSEDMRGALPRTGPSAFGSLDVLRVRFEVVDGRSVLWMDLPRAANIRFDRVP